MKIKLDDHEYVIRIPTKAWPYLQVLAQALSGAEVQEEKIDQAEKKVLEYCVSPQACEDHADVLLIRIISHYALQMREIAQQFR